MLKPVIRTCPFELFNSLVYILIARAYGLEEIDSRRQFPSFAGEFAVGRRRRSFGCRELSRPLRRESGEVELSGQRIVLGVKKLWRIVHRL